jgi:hypothetical protein
MRGYGRTDAPAEVEKYTQLHTAGDMIGLLDALDDGQPQRGRQTTAAHSRQCGDPPRTCRSLDEGEFAWDGAMRTGM